MSNLETRRFRETLRIGAFAGFAGGLAEVVWIALYGSATGAPTGAVAQGVVGSLFPALAASSSSVWLGVLIHMAIATALGLGLALTSGLLSSRDHAGYSEDVLVILALAGIWAVNFLVVLPYVNPDFVRLLPYTVTLLSKLLFGLSAATVFRANRMLRARIPRR